MTVGPWAKQWHARTAALTRVEAQLARSPDDVGLRLERAQLLEDLGLREDSAAAYVHVLVAHPWHYEAMMRLGALFATGGKADGARAVFHEATVHHPDRPAPYASLGNVLLDLGDAPGARAAFEAALGVDPGHLEAHRGLAIIFERAGDIAAADRAWRAGFPDGSIAISPFRGPNEPVRVLLVTSAIGGNIPLQHVLDDRVFQWATLIAESYVPTMTLPPHGVVFNAIGDHDRCARALEHADQLLERVDVDVINPPARVRGSGRADNADRLAALTGVVVPRVVAFARDALTAPDAVRTLAAHGFEWPLLVRSPGYHTGEHFELIATAADLAAAVQALPGEELLAISYLDTRRADGAWAKYRVMFIDGELYPLHLAISREWKVHYFTAAMSEEQAFRDEERAFLEDMAGTLGAPAVAMLREIGEALGLEYAGVDFAFDPQGRLAIFEANATMVILPPKDDPRFAYRKAPVQRALDAVRAMIIRRANAGAARLQFS
ncbi:MAG TPA: tetratricopeptide repeat protein [Candidatus Sulfotelmatobacter sp.]|nr:tetratricopeptide repeat protein [Candidatus Sulfotelmatobacter sp.]